MGQNWFEFTLDTVLIFCFCSPLCRLQNSKQDFYVTFLSDVLFGIGDLKRLKVGTVNLSEQKKEINA